MKDNSKTIVACDAFARLFSRGLAATREETMTNLQRIGKEVLRKAQVRLDMVAMLITRRWLEACIVDFEDMNLFLFADGSPQRRGLELYASTTVSCDQGEYYCQQYSCDAANWMRWARRSAYCGS